MTFFNKWCAFRLTEQQEEQIRIILREDEEEKYRGFSHFVRVAVVRQLEEEKFLKKEKEKKKKMLDLELYNIEQRNKNDETTNIQ